MDANSPSKKQSQRCMQLARDIIRKLVRCVNLGPLFPPHAKSDVEMNDFWDVTLSSFNLMGCVICQTSDAALSCFKSMTGEKKSCCPK